MDRILYKDIELEEANKKVHFSHSQFTERDINTDWMENLFSIDKNSLSHAQFGDISRLSSVVNLDYQVCNGGVAQYFDNGYDCYREPYNEQDVAHFGKSEQVSQLQALARFGETVFPEKALENSNIRHIADALNALDDSDEAEPWWAVEEGIDDDSNYYGESFEFEEFDMCFFASCGYLESLMELYAQYLCKSIDPERFGGRSSDETSCRDLACEARDMREGKDAFASIEQENVQGLRDCNR